MTLVSLVYARSRNGVIGADGGLPWSIPSDLKRFKATTLGKPIIMGRKTWESLPRKPLPGRPNIVLTRRTDFTAEGARVVHDVPRALQAAGDVPEVCVIGGGEIYALFFVLADRIYETVVDVDVTGDTHAPVLDPAEWIETDMATGERGLNDTASFVTRVLDRRR
jgi:dihydrofolate reductase